MYEYIITFQQEVSSICSRRCTGATVLFICNRYLLLIYAITSFITPTTTRVRLFTSQMHTTFMDFVDVRYRSMIVCGSSVTSHLLQL